MLLRILGGAPNHVRRKQARWPRRRRADWMGRAIEVRTHVLLRGSDPAQGRGRIQIQTASISRTVTAIGFRVPVKTVLTSSMVASCESTTTPRWNTGHEF